jgi:YqiJ-like protein
MSLLEFIYSEHNSLFTIALSVMFLIALLEGITIMLGMGVSSLFETLMPDVDLNIDSAELPQGTLSKLLSWLNYGKVPVLIIFICFLTAFGLIGYSIQYFLYITTSSLFPQTIIATLALLISFPFVKLLTSIIERIMPKDESSALSSESFIGKIATITLGTAKFGSPAEAKVRDIHGQTHYFMVEPELQNIDFIQGEDVLLSKLKSNGYYAIKNNYSSLKD